MEVEKSWELQRANNLLSAHCEHQVELCWNSHILRLHRSPPCRPHYQLLITMIHKYNCLDHPPHVGV